MTGDFKVVFLVEMLGQIQTHHSLKQNFNYKQLHAQMRITARATCMWLQPWLVECLYRRWARSQPQTPLISLLCFASHFWMHDWTLAWAACAMFGQKDRSARKVAAHRSDAELSVPCPFAQHRWAFCSQRPCEEVLCGQSHSGYLRQRPREYVVLCAL